MREEEKGEERVGDCLLAFDDIWEGGGRGENREKRKSEVKKLEWYVCTSLTLRGERS